MDSTAFGVIFSSFTVYVFSGKCFQIKPVKNISTYANITLQITPAEITNALCPTVLFEYLLGESAGKSQSS